MPQPTVTAAELTQLHRVITAARNYRRCAKVFMAATARWQSFAATHAHEDPGHDEHHRQVIAARQALNGAEAAWSEADEHLLTPPAPARRRGKAQTIRSLRKSIAQMEAA